jgi:hypothetical protein
MMIPLGSQQPYRQMPLNEYQFPTKSACYGPPYGIDYIDDGVDYNIMPQSYQQLNQDQHGLPYTPNPITRPWTPAPGLKVSGTAVYYDPDPACAYSPVPPLLYHSNASYALRSSISTESNNFSFHGMANSLPAPSPLTSNERVLPPLHRTSDEGSYGSSLAQNASPAIKIMPSDTSNQSTQPACLPLSVSPDGTSHSYAPTDNSTEQDIYGSNTSDWTSSAQDHQPSLRSHNSQAELFSYGPSSDNSSGRKLQRDNGGASGAGMLSNGQLYVPFPNPTSTSVTQALSDGLEHLHESTMHRESIRSSRVG